jgi:SAM-dependent methyltransferase
LIKPEASCKDAGVSAAPDGSPVELYALLPEMGEGDRVAQVVPAGSSILELGCGTGRITRQLVRLGYRVTAVDESPEMLAHVESAETVCSRIENLDLERAFDAALLASNLITAKPDQRRAFLRACKRHADVVVVEGLPLGWCPANGESDWKDSGEVRSRLRIDLVEGGVVHGAVEYAAGADWWRHEFEMRVFEDQNELDEALGEAGLHLDRWIDDEGGRWFIAVPTQSEGSAGRASLTPRAG